MNKTIDTLKKHNRIILFIFAAIEIITGLFSFSTVVVIDGINNTLFGAYSIKKQNRLHRYGFYLFRPLHFCLNCLSAPKQRMSSPAKNIKHNINPMQN